MQKPSHTSAKIASPYALCISFLCRSQAAPQPKRSSNLDVSFRFALSNSDTLKNVEMKIRKYLTSVVAFLCLCLVSCSKEDALPVSVPTAKAGVEQGCVGGSSSLNEFTLDNRELSSYMQDANMRSFMQDVDKLSNKPPRPQKNGYGNRTADVVDGLAGSIAQYLLKWPSAGAICGAVASFMYSKLEESLHKKGWYEKPVDPELSGDELLWNSSNRSHYKFNIEDHSVILKESSLHVSFIDSVGYYHNALLSALSKRGTGCADSLGFISYDRLCQDAEQRFNSSLQRRTLMDNTPEASCLTDANQEEYDAVKNFTTSFVQNMSSGLGFYKSFEASRANTIDLLQCRKSDVDAIRDLCQKILTASHGVSNSESVNYSRRLNQLIEKSCLSQVQKEAFKCLNNIFINSRLYWYR